MWLSGNLHTETTCINRSLFFFFLKNHIFFKEPHFSMVLNISPADCSVLMMTMRQLSVGRAPSQMMVLSLTLTPQGKSHINHLYIHRCQRPSPVNLPNSVSLLQSHIIVLTLKLFICYEIHIHVHHARTHAIPKGKPHTGMLL